MYIYERDARGFSAAIIRAIEGTGRKIKRINPQQTASGDDVINARLMIRSIRKRSLLAIDLFVHAIVTKLRQSFASAVKWMKIASSNIIRYYAKMYF